MIALIVRNDPARAAAMSLTMMDIGFHVMCVDNLSAAEAIARGGMIDAILTDERVGGELAHNLLLSVERRNPHVCAFLLTDKVGVDADELFLLMPAVYALLPPDAPMEMLTRFVHSALKYDGDQAKLPADAATALRVFEDMLDDWEDEVVPDLADDAALHDPSASVPTVQPPAVIGGFQSVRTPVMH